jgi:hypothetical protein
MDNPEPEGGTRQGIQSTISTLYLKTDAHLGYQSLIDPDL